MEAASRFFHSHPLPTPSISIPKPAPKPLLSLLPSLPIKPYSARLPFPVKIPSNFPLRPKHKHVAPIFASSSLHDLPQNPQLKTLPKPLSLLPFPSLDLTRITPLAVCKWSAVLAAALFAVRRTVAALLNPFFWTYFSWTWVFWPWIAAVAVAAYGLYCFRRYSLGKATVFEQLAVVTAAITWLTLVPTAHFNGFLEGWPIGLFFVYHYFFFFESSVRKRLYGDLYPRAHDPKWDVSLPRPFRIGFAALVFIGHWLAAQEGPELHLISGGWANLATWALVAVTLFARYHSVLYLAKYSEKVAVPTAVVQFGPYRWVRHPIYASTMLLFALHCVTLRAPLSLLFLVAVCLVYYGRKAELEEALMVETFGERYTEYANKVRYRLIPLLY